MEGGGRRWEAQGRTLSSGCGEGLERLWEGLSAVASTSCGSAEVAATRSRPLLAKLATTSPSDSP